MSITLPIFVMVPRAPFSGRTTVYKWLLSMTWPLSLLGRRARQPADDLRHIKATTLAHASLASATRLREWRTS
jgi:hypothetical protein